MSKSFRVTSIEFKHDTCVYYATSIARLDGKIRRRRRRKPLRKRKKNTTRRRNKRCQNNLCFKNFSRAHEGGTTSFIYHNKPVAISLPTQKLCALRKFAVVIKSLAYSLGNRKKEKNFGFYALN